MGNLPLDPGVDHIIFSNDSLLVEAELWHCSDCTEKAYYIFRFGWLLVEMWAKWPNFACHLLSELT